MKYRKLIIAFLLLNLFLVFSMIFIANKTREIEKNNNNLKFSILKIKEDTKINAIELTSHKNSSYLKKLHSLYFTESIKSKPSNIVLIDQLLNEDQNIKLVNADN